MGVITFEHLHDVGDLVWFVASNNFNYSRDGIREPSMCLAEGKVSGMSYSKDTLDGSGTVVYECILPDTSTYWVDQEFTHSTLQEAREAQDSIPFNSEFWNERN